MKNETGQLNNKGFTLIELIVGSLISVLVVLAVTLFIGNSLNLFNSTGARAAIQNEMQIVQNQVGNMIMEADSIQKEANASVDAYRLTVTEEDSVGLLLVYDPSNMTLLIGEGDQTPEEIAANQKQSLLASRISKFTLSPSSVDAKKGNNMVTVNLEITINGKTADSSIGYTLRNGEW